VGFLRRAKANAFEAEIHEAIVLACTDMPGADERLTASLGRARTAGDRIAVIACLKALSVFASATGRENGRWLSICRELVHEDPENPSNWISLGNAEDGSGALDKACEAYTKALDLSKDPRTKQLVRHFLDRCRGTPPTE
jgi:predicted Zn-dependent protease